MKPYNVHILYEYGTDLRPYGSSFIRLLRPLSHPTINDKLNITSSLDYEEEEADAVIVDRLWRPDISFALALRLIYCIHRAGVKLIYTIDDNLLDAPVHENGRPSQEDISVIELFLRHADLVLVSTYPLQDRLSGYNSNIVVVPNALDERLLAKQPTRSTSLFGPKRLVIGYMGTFTHDEDLLMILPALQTLYQHHPEKFEIQLIGGANRQQTVRSLEALPIRWIIPKEEVEYPLFMLWFSSRLQWDIAIAPLRSTPFTRCKSDIKFLDYSSIGAAGIYSRVPAYETTVRHKETGWLVDNEVEAWIEALETLLADASLRKQLAEQSIKYLYAERILAHQATVWLEALEILLNKS